VGGVPVAEIEAQRPLFDALGFDPGRVFSFNGKPQAPVPNDSANAVACGSPLNDYAEFSPAVTDRSAIRPLIEEDPGVQARVQEVRDALAAWWVAHAGRLAELPVRRDLNTVRNELLDTFTQALLPLGVLDRFKLAGVVATWWTDTLTDFKTLLENGFAGVIDGWIDAIAEAVVDGAIINYHIIRIAVDPVTCDSRFLFACFNSALLKGQIHSEKGKVPVRA
jgi:type I restriction enzyme M protein